MCNKTIIVIPGANEQQLNEFADRLSDSTKELFITGKDIKVYKFIEGTPYEVKERLEKVGENNV